MINVLIAIAGTVLANRYISVNQNKLKKDINSIKNYISKKKIDLQDKPNDEVI